MRRHGLVLFLLTCVFFGLRSLYCSNRGLDVSKLGATNAKKKEPQQQQQHRPTTNFVSGPVSRRDNGRCTSRLTRRFSLFLAPPPPTPLSRSRVSGQVASTVDRVRGQSTGEDFTKSFFAVKMNLGIAPSDGLYLERPLYGPYNAQ